MPRNNILDLLKMVGIISMLYIHITMWYLGASPSPAYIIGVIAIPLFFFCAGASTIYSKSIKGVIYRNIIIFLLGVIMSLTVNILLFSAPIILIFTGTLQLIAINKVIMAYVNKYLRNKMWVVLVLYIVYDVSMGFILKGFSQTLMTWFPLGLLFAQKYGDRNINHKFILGRYSLTAFFTHQYIFLYPVYFLGLYQECGYIITNLVFLSALLFYLIWSYLAFYKKIYSIETIIINIKKIS
ncbi:MAG: hypothetical protein ACTSYZ_09020 [Candidatus Helarchaeota archaeon]